MLVNNASKRWYDIVNVQDNQVMPMDHLTFCTLSTLDKLLNDNVIRNPNYSDQLMETWSKLVPIFDDIIRVCGGFSSSSATS